MPDAEERLIHDLRNAAGVIRGAALQLQEDLDAAEGGTADQLLEILVRRSDMLVRLVGDLSIVRQVGRGDLRVSMQPVDVGVVCRQAVAGAHRDDRQVAVDIGPDVVALGDPLRVTQIVDNLVGNALRYGGPRVSVSAQRTGDEVRIAVADDGEGVPPELLGTLFEVYARGPRSEEHGGSGLGLAIVHDLCAALGGRVTYDGSAGATFEVTLQAPPRVPGQRLSPDGTHALLVWRDMAALADKMVAYTLDGLSRGEAVVLAARVDLLDHVLEELERLGVATDRFLASGQLVPLDAEELRGKLVVDGWIESDRFQTVAGTIIEQVSARWRTVKVCSEFAGLFWLDGEEPLALEAERLWSALATRYGVASVCLYPATPDPTAADGPVPAWHDAVVTG